MLTLFLLSYTLGAVVTYGAVFSYWENEVPGSADNKQDAIEVGIFWPMQTLSYLSVFGRKPFQSGLKFY